jgi:hypothetical protein
MQPICVHRASILFIFCSGLLRFVPILFRSCCGFDPNCIHFVSVLMFGSDGFVRKHCAESDIWSSWEIVLHNPS